MAVARARRRCSGYSRLRRSQSLVCREHCTQLSIHPSLVRNPVVRCVGGSLPVTTSEFARRAYCAVANPQLNPLKEVMDMCESVEKTPPLLGIFNDIPANKIREDEVRCCHAV